MRRSEHLICDRAWLCLALHSLAHEKCHSRPLSNHDLMGRTTAHQVLTLHAAWLQAVADIWLATPGRFETSFASYIVFMHHFIGSLLS